MSKLLFLLLAVQLLLISGIGQTGAAPIVKADGNACELNSMYIDNLFIEAANDPSSRVVAKYYPAKGERSSVNDRRSEYVRTFLARSKRVDVSRIVFESVGSAEPEVDAKIEFYLVKAGESEGKLYLVTRARKDMTPCMDCCAEGFYPKSLEQKPSTKKKKVSRRTG